MVQVRRQNDALILMGPRAHLNKWSHSQDIASATSALGELCIIQPQVFQKLLRQFTHLLWLNGWKQLSGWCCYECVYSSFNLCGSGQQTFIWGEDGELEDNLKVALLMWLRNFLILLEANWKYFLFGFLRALKMCSASLQCRQKITIHHMCDGRIRILF